VNDALRLREENYGDKRSINRMPGGLYLYNTAGHTLTLVLKKNLRAATGVRGWVDRPALSKAMGLGPEQRIILSQTVGYPKD
jgi:hypothetical protein